MITIFGIIETIIFFILSVIHFNWAFGGDWGFNNALPTNTEGGRVLNPKKRDSAIVAFGLLAFSIYYLVKVDILTAGMPDWMLNYGGWFIIVIFIVRAIGDFKYIGFFKSIRTTNFAKLDSTFYAPLCLTIGTIGICIELLSN